VLQARGWLAGAAMILFEVPGHAPVLHTGDFRSGWLLGCPVTRMIHIQYMPLAAAKL